MTGAAGERSFRVPYGLAPDGSVTDRGGAIEGVEYRCPACSSPLIARNGRVVRDHFAHRAASNCSPETALHAATKLRIALAVEDWRSAGGPVPVVRRRCPRCHHDVDAPLRDIIVIARTEVRLDSGRVLDVALFDAHGTVRMGVEVLVAHAVDESKERDLGDLTWIEVDAGAVVDPTVWPVKRGKAVPLRCPECATRDAVRPARRAALLASVGLADPGERYLVVPTTCWRCQRTTPVFFWPHMIGDGRPPAPAPRTIKHRYSQTVNRSYVSNGCARCDALIGEHFLSQILAEAGDDVRDMDAALALYLDYTDRR